jgi:FimV-like protein
VNKLHLKKLGLILCMAAMPWWAHAASLGKLSVFSSLGEPLNAEIDVFPGSDEELSSLTTTLASDAVYREQGVERSAAQSDVRVAILKKDDGSVVVKLNSAHPIGDPFLDMIIALNWKDGNLVREYTLLLDPPGQTSAEVNNANVDAPKSITAVKAMDAAKESSGNILVKNGDSLAAIAKRVQDPGVNLDQLLVAFYLENKQAFDGKNMNRLKAGVLLKMPSQETLLAVSSEEAKREVQAQAAEWSAYENKLATAVAESAASEALNHSTNSGKVVSKVDENASTTETAPRDVVKLSKSENAQLKDAASHVDALKDDLAAKQNAITNTEEKTDSVEKKIADMRQLLAIKNQSLANTQNNAEQSGGPKTPKLVTLWQAMHPKIKAFAVVLALLGFILLLLRSKSPKKPALPVQEPIPTLAANGANHHPMPAVDEVPQLKSFDLSSISLDFEPVVTAVETEKPIEPIPDVFNGDFSNLLKVEPVSNSVKLGRKTVSPRAKSATKSVDFSDIETKLELAISYVDMRDKRGAKKLLNEVLKQGDESQKARAQAFIDQLK